MTFSLEFLNSPVVRLHETVPKFVVSYHSDCILTVKEEDKMHTYLSMLLLFSPENWKEENKFSSHDKSDTLSPFTFLGLHLVQSVLHCPPFLPHSALVYPNCRSSSQVGSYLKIDKVRD